MWKVNGRTITDDYIIRVETWAGAKKAVAKLEELGYKFAASVEKHSCYYVARSVVFDDGSEPTKKTINWGRDEVKESDEFDKMQTYEEFMGEPEPEDKVKKTKKVKSIHIEDILNKAIKENLKVSWRYVEYSDDTWTVGKLITNNQKRSLLSDDSVVQIRVAFDV